MAPLGWNEWSVRASTLQPRRGDEWPSSLLSLAFTLGEKIYRRKQLLSVCRKTLLRDSRGQLRCWNLLFPPPSSFSYPLSIWGDAQSAGGSGGRRPRCKLTAGPRSQIMDVWPSYLLVLLPAQSPLMNKLWSVWLITCGLVSVDLQACWLAGTAGGNDVWKDAFWAANYFTTF